jgi:hypothetical protein
MPRRALLSASLAIAVGLAVALRQAPARAEAGPFAPGDVRARVLARVRAAAAAGERPIVVFDLDDTLFDTRWRILTVLHDYGRGHHLSALTHLEADDVRWDDRDTLGDAGLSGARERAALSYLHQHTYHAYALDLPFDGALDYVLAVRAAGGRVAYVTGRSESARNVSEQVLEAAGFPLTGTLRYFRPASESSIPAYKGRVARQSLPHYGEVVATFDNEPANCDAFERAAPAATNVFLDTRYPDDSPALLAGVERVTSWR